MSGHATPAAAIVLAASIFLVCPASAAAGPPPRPVIIIPGIMGSVLELQDTHRQIWGSYFRMSFSSPHRGLVDPTHDGLELPTTSEDLRENRDALVPTGLLERMTIVPRIMAVRVYAAWVKRLTEAGYGTGDIDHPAKGDTCFVFFYDWRRDLAETAQHLAERIDAIRAAYGDPDLKVDLIAHSMGGLVARYYVLYGGADVIASDDLPAATMAGAAHVANMVLLAAPNEGSQMSFDALLRGTRVGLRHVSPLVLFTMPSMFMLLPPPGDPVFVDQSGATLPIDVYDPATWARQRWSIYNPVLRSAFRQECRSAFKDGADAAVAAKYEEWGRYLGVVLARARRFHAALAADKRVPVPLAYYVFGGDCTPTVSRSVVFADASGPVTSSARSRRPPGMSGRAFDALVLAPGDGMVVRSSLLGNPASDSTSGPSAFRGSMASTSCVTHNQVQGSKSVQRRVVALLQADRR